MPPLNSFIFECISDVQTEIIISTYGNEKDALKRLEFHVKNINNWKLKTLTK